MGKPPLRLLPETIAAGLAASARYQAAGELCRPVGPSVGRPGALVKGPTAGLFGASDPWHASDRVRKSTCPPKGTEAASLASREGQASLLCFSDYPVMRSYQAPPQRGGEPWELGADQAAGAGRRTGGGPGQAILDESVGDGLELPGEPFHAALPVPHQP